METHCISLSFTSDSIGGEYYHKLTQPELPDVVIQEGVGDSPFVAPNKFPYAPTDNKVYGWSLQYKEYHQDYPCYTYPIGNGASHNNIMPYITTYMFKRTA